MCHPNLRGCWQFGPQDFDGSSKSKKLEDAEKMRKLKEVRPRRATPTAVCPSHSL
jgi:hypothetical protein